MVKLRMLPGGGGYTFDETFGSHVSIKYEIFVAGHEEQKLVFGPYTMELVKNMTSGIENLFEYDKASYDVSVNGKNATAFVRFDSKEGADTSEGITYAYPFSESNISMSYTICDYSLEGDAPKITDEQFNSRWISQRWKQNYEKVKIEIRDSENAAIGFDYTLERYIHPNFVNDGVNGNNNQRLLLTIGNEQLLMNGLNDYFDFYKIGERVRNTSGVYVYKMQYRKATTAMAISYSDGKLYNSSGNYITTVKTGIDGKTFNGFPSKKAYVTLKFEGVTGKVGVSFSAAGGFPLFTRYKESGEKYFANWQSPRIQLTSSLKSAYHIGDTVSIPNAYATYETASHLDVKFTVEDPDGEIVGKFDEMPVADGYSFVIDRLGTYSIYYSTQDSVSGRKGSRTIEITIDDDGVPTVLILGEKTVRVKAGEEVALPEAIVQDDTDESEDIELYILIDDGNYSVKLIGYKTESLKSFTAPKKKGTYKIRYAAVDTSSNIGYAEFTLIVE